MKHKIVYSLLFVAAIYASVFAGWFAAYLMLKGYPNAWGWVMISVLFYFLAAGVHYKNR